jgi:hypothetical protein
MVDPQCKVQILSSTAREKFLPEDGDPLIPLESSVFIAVSRKVVHYFLGLPIADLRAVSQLMIFGGFE